MSALAEAKETGRGAPSLIAAACLAHGAVAAPHELRVGLLDAYGGIFTIGRPATASVKRLDLSC